MRRTLVMIAVGTLFFVSPLVAQSQDTTGSDFPTDQVEAAKKQLDQFLETRSARYRLPFAVSEKEKSDLVKKYLGEADKSPYFWKNLDETFYRVLYGGTAPAGNVPPPDYVVAAYVVRESYSIVMAAEWGSLALSSEPSGAEVFLKLSSGRTKEGTTKINRRYPKGGYTFVVELSGYKSREVTVSIDRDKPVDEKVVLEKQ